MTITPWDDGIVTEDELRVILNTPELRQMFMSLAEEEQYNILKKSAPDKSEMAKIMDKLAKYLKSSWFRNLALKKAADFGLNEQEADHFARIWKLDLDAERLYRAKMSQTTFDDLL